MKQMRLSFIVRNSKQALTALNWEFVYHWTDITGEKTSFDHGPAIIYNSGKIIYYRNNRRHRENGPAYIVQSGYQVYYSNGAIHNVNGPAIVWPDGHIEYWLYNESMSDYQWRDKREEFKV